MCASRASMACRHGRCAKSSATWPTAFSPSPTCPSAGCCAPAWAARWRPRRGAPPCQPPSCSAPSLFPALPIRWLLRAGLGGPLAATAVGAAVLAAKLLGAITVPGYAMIMLTIVFFGALNLLSLGVVGSYAWRAYENTKARPLAVVLRDEQFGPPGVSNPGEQPHA